MKKKEPKQSTEPRREDFVDGETPSTGVKKRGGQKNADVSQTQPEQMGEERPTHADALKATKETKVGRRAARRSPEQLEAQLRDILRQATPSAARLLAQAIDNEELSISLRLDCAKDILNRVYGKQAPPEEPKSVTFVLEEALHEYAR